MHLLLFAAILVQEPDKIDWKIAKIQREARNDVTGFLRETLQYCPKNGLNGDLSHRNFDHATWVHEATHVVQAHLRDYQEYQNAFYVGQGRYILLKEPRSFTLDDVKVHSDFKENHRYKQYMVNQLKHWGNQPLYIFDEWTAYTNELVYVQENIEKYSKPKKIKSDDILGFLQLGVCSVYVLDTCHPRYKDLQQLKQYTRWNLLRGMKLYKELSKYEQLNYDNREFFNLMKSNIEFNMILTRHFGANFVSLLYKN